jgi:transcriptional regulator with XRE-family HTH domain
MVTANRQRRGDVNIRTGPRTRPGFLAARRRLGMNQEAAAEAVGVSPSTWARWERGERDVHATHRVRIAEAFATTPAEVDLRPLTPPGRRCRWPTP